MNRLKFNNTTNQFKFLINEIKIIKSTTVNKNQKSLSSLFNNLKSFQNTTITNNNNITKLFKRSFSNQYNRNNRNNRNNKIESLNKKYNNSRNNFEFNFENWSNEQKQKYFKSSKTANLIYALIGINTAAFLYINSNDDYSFQRFIEKNFYLSLDNFLKQPFTLITSFFSHQSFGHFLFNMVGLFTIGPHVLYTLGASSFFGLYMASGIASGLAFLGLQKYYRDDAKNYSFSSFFSNKNINQYKYSMQRSQQYALGASGAIFGVMAVFACLFPNQVLSLYGVIPIPAMVAVGGFIAYDLYQEVSQADSRVCHVGHLGGAAFGILYYLFRLKGRY